MPDAPLTAAGLATPYQLVATDPAAGVCNETNTNQSAFVQAGIFDPATGSISVYNPLVIDQGTAAATAPVVPVLPANAIVALWFGYNGNDLTLQGNAGVLQASACVNGVANSDFGQYSYCNAPAFFRAANAAVSSGQLVVPPLGIATDGKPCPSVRDFAVVDQDQSDNLPTTYLITAAGAMAQYSQANLAAFPGAKKLNNASDNRLVDVLLDGALGCTPWKAADLADPGQSIAALPLNEMQARANQLAPVALVPAGDPMVLNNAAMDIVKLNAYRLGVDQPTVTNLMQADTMLYCQNLFNFAPPKLQLDRPFLTVAASPDPAAADSLFTFLAARFVATDGILGCANLLGVVNPVTVITNANGVAVDAVINIMPIVVVATNQNCTLIVPDAPLTAQGLATPYQLVATDPAAGVCQEASVGQSAFVQAAILDPATGAISIYNPLVIDQGATAAAAPVVPTLPANAVVGLWFGYNANDLTLQSGPGVLQANGCVNGVANSDFGQFSSCNAAAFFTAANAAVANGQLVVPPLGTAADGRPCPTVRDFSVVDQDQSDNLPTSYLITANGMAQFNQANLAAFPGATVLGNASDNRLVDVLLDGALGCTAWKAPDLADAGQNIPALPLNELQAKATQQAPVALVPAGDPMVLNNGAADLTKLNAYRRAVDQPVVNSVSEADTTLYCQNLFNTTPAKLKLDKTLLTAAASPDAGAANSLFTFLAQRFVASDSILGCANLLKRTNPVTVITDGNGVAIDATIQ